MEGADGFDISDIDPELAAILGEGPALDYPTIHDPQHIAGLASTPNDGGIEDEELDSVLGNPEELYRHIGDDDAGPETDAG